MPTVSWSDVCVPVAIRVMLINDGQRSLERGERCKDPTMPRIGHLCVGVNLLREWPQFYIIGI